MRRGHGRDLILLVGHGFLERPVIPGDAPGWTTRASAILALKDESRTADVPDFEQARP
jgi:hypothetical protein